MRNQGMGAAVAVWIFAGLAQAQVTPSNSINPVQTLPSRLIQEETFHREKGGIRVKPPGVDTDEASARYQNFWLLEFPVAMSGPFEVKAAFAVHQLGQVKQSGSQGSEDPGACHAAMILQCRGIEGHYGIGTASDPQFDSNQPSCFQVTRAEAGPTGMQRQVLNFPRRSKQGRIALRRDGSQLIFLAADGESEDFKELVRFPYDSRVEPTLGLEAFQGNGSTMMPVDVSFRAWEMRAAKVLKGAQVQRTFVANLDVGDYPGMVDYRERPGAFFADTTMTTHNRGEAFHVEGDLLRVRPPMCPADLRGASSYWARDLNYEVAGDFELSSDFEVLQMGPPALEGDGAIGVFLGIETAGPLGSIQFGRGCLRNVSSDRSPQGYILTRTSYCGPSADSAGNTGADQIATKRVQETIHFPTRARKGRLIVRRIGEELHFLVEEEKGAAQLLYKTFAIIDPAMKLNLVADQGGSPSTAVDVQLSRIILKANALSAGGEKVDLSPSVLIDPEPMQFAELPQEGPPRFWLYATLSAGAAAGVLSWSILSLGRFGF